MSVSPIMMTPKSAMPSLANTLTGANCATAPTQSTCVGKQRTNLLLPSPPQLPPNQQPPNQPPRSECPEPAAFKVSYAVKLHSDYHTHHPSSSSSSSHSSKLHSSTSVASSNCNDYMHSVSVSVPDNIHSVSVSVPTKKCLTQPLHDIYEQAASVRSSPLNWE